jgi:hypothetical protein
MKIEFELQGVKMVIKYDGNCYTALKPGTDYVLGYYTKIGNALNRILLDVNLPEEAGQEETIQLKEYVDRFERLINEVRGYGVEDIFGAVVIEGEKRVMSQEHKDKIKASKQKAKSEEYNPFE